MKIKMILLAATFLFLSSTFLSAEDLFSDVKNFQKYNPDVNKYEFVKSYLTALTYLQTNVDRHERTESELADREEVDKIPFYQEDLIQNNVNLRIARNYVKKYSKDTKNGLILHTAHIFQDLCNQYIELNNQERSNLNAYYQALLYDNLEKFDKDTYQAELIRISNQRRNVSEKLLETSNLVSKILISSKVDAYGEFYQLGITEYEREKLIHRFDEFKGPGFQGNLREGQTFLEGSVSTVREILEDESWASLDI